MKEKITEYFEKHKEEMLSCISDLVSIRSVRSEALPGMPFGRENRKALDYIIDLSEKFGFIVKDYDGYVSTAQLTDREPYLQIFSHLDIVPEGDGWHTDPYRMEFRDGNLIGRGTSDDKGAAVACLFALRAVRDLRIPLSRNCRLVFGTDEECGSSDLEYYFRSEKKPELAFTPDSEFPVTVGEKGRFTKRFFTECDFSGEEKKLCGFYGGKTENAVPDTACCIVEGFSEEEINTAAAEAASATGTVFHTEDNRIVCSGTATHASLPEQGNNPVTALLYMLSLMDFGEKGRRFVKNLSEMFPHGKYYGEGFGVSMEDKLGKLTMSLDVVNFDGIRFEGCFDTRVPGCADSENCSGVIAKVLSARGFEIENTEMIPSHYVDGNSSFVKTLLSVYEEYTGKKGYCVCVGGGTYVHNMENAVAFGAIPENMNTNMHAADEYMPVESLVQAAEIFTQAIANICK